MSINPTICIHKAQQTSKYKKLVLIRYSSNVLVTKIESNCKAVLIIPKLQTSEIYYVHPLCTKSLEEKFHHSLVHSPDD